MIILNDHFRLKNGFITRALTAVSVLTLIAAFFYGPVGVQGAEKTSFKASQSSAAGSPVLAAYDSAEGLPSDPDAEYEERFLSASYKKNGYTKKDLKYMTAVIYCEANGMSFDAKVAVGNVILNRVADTDPNGFSHVSTIKDVIYDTKWCRQFAVTAGNPSAMDKAMALYKSMDPDKYKEWEIEEMNKAKKAALAVLSGYKTIPDSFLYFNGYIERSIDNCRDRGWSFCIMEQHIYHGKY